MADIVRLFFIVFLIVVGLTAYVLVVNALFAPRITRTKSIARSTPVRSLGIGLVNFLFFAAIALVLLSVAENTGTVLRAILTLPALVILALLTIGLSLGLTAMANLIGEQIFSDLPARKQLLWGTVCLALACALPFVGWFLLFPYVGLSGMGAVLLGFLKRSEQS